MMEGYTNVIGSPYDFDDLDIEGSERVDEWNVEERKVTHNIKPLQHIDETAILSTHVRLDNGQQADVFSVVNKRDSRWYTCHVCSDTVVGSGALRHHIESAGHKAKMNLPVHPRTRFIKLDPKENVALEPGEPVPPGLEETIIKNCIIQPTLDAYKSLPLIGLEFLVEMTQCPLDFELMYFCLLCDKTGSERNMLIHLTSVFHYMKYLSIYFPTLARKLHELPNKKLKKCFGLLVQEICGDIESKYGRLKPKWLTYSDFYSTGRKQELSKEATEGPHIREINGELFDEKATVENIERKARELISKPPATPEVDPKSKALALTFNRTKQEKKIDRWQFEPRKENKGGSPDIQIVDVQLPENPPESGRRVRSRSLSSVSTISSTTSQGRNRSQNRYQGRSRQHQPVSGRNRSRSRSDNRTRSRSRDRGRGGHGRRSPRRRDRSPHNERGRLSGRNRSPDSHRSKGIDRFGRTREQHERSDKYDRHRRDDRERSQKYEKYEEDIRKLDKSQWDKFREEMRQLEAEKIEKLKYHEKNPEKHPQYPEEWKGFWNKRYNELQRAGVDPAKHDFKPEWISFWTKRMKELHDEDLRLAKEELKNKYELPDDPFAERDRNVPWKYNQRRRNNSSPGLVDISPPTPEKRDVINNIKSTWKALTGSDIKEAPKRPLSPWEDEPRMRESPPGKRKNKSKSPSPDLNDINEKLLEEMPQRKTRTSSLIFVLRKLTVLEEQLGSLGPKVFDLLSQSLALEKVKENASLDLLHEIENSMFLETVREKLIALLCAGVVPRNVVNTARAAIKHTDISLYIASKRERVLPIDQMRSLLGIQPMYPLTNTMAVQPPVEPVTVPGIGTVDKGAIAQQIAQALVAQGKTNVNEAELAQLVNAVVGMAEASANSSQPMTTANFLSQLQSMQNNPANNYQMPPANTLNFNLTANVVPKHDFPMMQSQPSFSSHQAPPNLSQPQQSSSYHLQPLPQPLLTSQQGSTSVPQAIPPSSSLKLLQSAYDDVAKSDSPKPYVEIVSSDTKMGSEISDIDLAATLASFNKLSKDQQPYFVQKLLTSNPAMLKRLRPFIPENIVIESEKVCPKRTPINISLSKEKSEQKIKTNSDQLFPFSSRDTDANPIDERVDKTEKNKIPLLSDNASLNQGIMKHGYDKDNNYDDDDDEDDDYTFEDVYKAAHEKLRQKEVEEDVKSDKSLEIVNPELDENTQATQSTGKDRPISNVSSQMQFSQDEHSVGNVIGTSKLLQPDPPQRLSSIDQRDRIVSPSLMENVNSNLPVGDSFSLENPLNKAQFNYPQSGSLQEAYIDAHREQGHPDKREVFDSQNAYSKDPNYRQPFQESINNPRDPSHLSHNRGPAHDSFNRGPFQEVIHDSRKTFRDPYMQGSAQDLHNKMSIQDPYSRAPTEDPYGRGHTQSSYFPQRGSTHNLFDSQNRQSQDYYGGLGAADAPCPISRDAVRNPYAARGPMQESQVSSHRGYGSSSLSDPYNLPPRGSQVNPQFGGTVNSYDDKRQQEYGHYDRPEEHFGEPRGGYHLPTSSRYSDNRFYRY